MTYKTTGKAVIYAQGEYGKGFSKMTDVLVRYGKYDFIGIVDKNRVGKNISDFINVDRKISFIATLDEALKEKPETLIIGVAPRDGKLPPEWKKDIFIAMQNGLNIYNGMHNFLTDDKEFSNAASKYNVQIWDLRKPPTGLKVGMGLTKDIKSKVVMTIGTDCAIGKLTATIELENEAQKRNFKSVLIPTGQTAMAIYGFGISVDAVVGDFMAGACEKLVLDHAKDNDFIFVEGQGSIFHVGYSGVTLSMLHGVLPTHMVLCHNPLRTCMKDSNLKLPSLPYIAKMYENMTPEYRKGKVVGVCMNLSKYTDKESKRIINEIEEKTGLPTTDPIKYGVRTIFDNIK